MIESNKKIIFNMEGLGMLINNKKNNALPILGLFNRTRAHKNGHPHCMAYFNHHIFKIQFNFTTEK